MGLGRLRFGKEEIFTIIVKDVDGRPLEKWVCNKSDFPKICNILVRKLGIKMRVIEKDSSSEDLNWALS